MGLHTPIDNRFRFGELYGIRNSYSGMVRSIEESRLEKQIYDLMMAQLVESGNLEKIERFAKKNASLRDFAYDNSMNEAVSAMEKSTKGTDIPKAIRKSAVDKFKRNVWESVSSIKPSEFSFPSFKSEINEAEDTTEDDIELSASQEEESDSIDKLISNISLNKGNDIIQSKSDREFEKELANRTTSEAAVKHNYSIRTIILESIAGNIQRTKLIPPTTIYSFNDGTEPKDYLNTTMKSVVNGINAACGLNFPESDYIWLASGRPTPFLKCEMVVNADAVKGNRFLNAFFGPAGEFKDYLYRADGTPRLPPSDAGVMNSIDREVNVISSYPIIKVYTTVISWDMVNGEEKLREIGKEDFKGTAIKVID